MKKRVLIIDDDAIWLKFISDALSNYDYDIEKVKSFGEALSKLRCKKSNYYLVITDIWLKETDINRNGIFLLEEMIAKQSQANGMVITCDSSLETREKLELLGIPYIIKEEFTPDFFIQVLMKLGCIKNNSDQIGNCFYKGNRILFYSNLMFSKNIITN